MKKSVNKLPVAVQWLFLFAIASMVTGLLVLLFSAIIINPYVTEAGAALISAGVITIFLIIIFYPRE